MVKIVISGTGGVGGYYGGVLAKTYENSKEVEVYFLSRGESLKHIQAEGLQIDSYERGEFTARPRLATNDPKEIGQADYLICATKSYDLEDNIRQLSPCIGKHTVIVPLLNGADITDRIRRVVSQTEVWYGLTYIVSFILAPGQITEKTNPRNKLLFGSPDHPKDRQQELLKIFTEAGINAFNPDNIVEEVWRKYLFISTAALATTYYNSCYGHVWEEKAEEFRGLVEEAVAAAHAIGVELPTAIIEDTIATLHRYPGEATTSMQRDYYAGKAFELETLGGLVLNIGKQKGLNFPIHQQMIEKIERR